jgi:biopolymer transport protein ExbD
LPQAEGKSFELASNNPAKITVTAAGAVYLDGTASVLENLELPRADAAARAIKRALLEADEGVPYGTGGGVLDVMNRAGVEQLGMITQPKEKGEGNAGPRR